MFREYEAVHAGINGASGAPSVRRLAHGDDRKLGCLPFEVCDQRQLAGINRVQMEY